MGSLAERLPKYDTGTRGAHGRSAGCDIYGPGDIDDWRAVLAIQGRADWAEAQREVDKALNIAEPISSGSFKHHWLRKCGHWTPEQRLAQL